MPRKWSVSLSTAPGQITNVAPIGDGLNGIGHYKNPTRKNSACPIYRNEAGAVCCFTCFILRLPEVLRYGTRPGRRRFRRGRR